MRRRFLLSAMALAPAAAWFTARPGFAQLVEGVFSDPGGARAVGRRHLAGDPDAEAAARDLGARLRAARPADPAELRRILAGYRQGDVARRDVVLVDGWVLLRTEAEACALLALL